MAIPDFLSPTFIEQHTTAAGLTQTAIAELVALAERITADPALQRCVEQLFAQVYQRADVVIDPPVETLFGAEANKLYLLLAVNAVHQLRTIQAQRGIPEAIILESHGALAMTARRYASWHGGQTGVEERVLRNWLGRTTASGNLYRLGRMEYILKAFDGNLRVYRHKQSGQVQALAEEGVHFMADGYLPFTFDERTYTFYGWPKAEPTEERWTMQLIEDETTITGTPISPAGYALRTPLQLVKAQWELVLRNGDTVLDMHIPSFMPLSLDLLQASLHRALDFFPRYHPERPFKAFVCGSWLFNTQWEALLPAHSNILAFQRQGYLYPLPSNGAGGLYFIFGEQIVDLNKASQETELQRAVIKHMRAGGKLRNGGFLLLPEDATKFGKEPYRHA
ncbi:MAG: acyltransferase domain-containing protein [Caldilineaceae bacterium]